ncbi:CoA pyrophosphatase [Rheinheimera sp. 4Y26]|uniref:CoA pyrophosphatase n=1 Tax=Rheinheimera sp. 4Y26 TaxID=2977811 RepID=UPI0021B103A8|nr:CoA pyrophosphatase [Rheinheimera sp. 4Y26]MCT6700811.1 CoA pyrophosphatase [Rheinheimera sp. 4Y26]
MYFADFYPRFLLTRQQHSQGSTNATGPANAAVMLLLWPESDGLKLLLTRRAQHLRHHPGQISLPGGKIEPEESAAAAALRETEEEVGLSASHIQLLGSLPLINTSTGFVVSPWLGFIEQKPQWCINTNEVDSLIELPLSLALSAQHRTSLWFERKAQKQLLHFIPYQGSLIWGATAAILQQLAEQTTW